MQTESIVKEKDIYPETLEKPPFHPVAHIKNPGIIVKTRLGIGIYYQSDCPVKGKLPIILEDGRKILCHPDNIEPIGYVD